MCIRDRSVSDYIASVQLSREQIRAKNKETLLNIINNQNIEETAKQQAIQDMIALTEVAEKENAAETLLMAKDVYKRQGQDLKRETTGKTLFHSS